MPPTPTPSPSDMHILTPLCSVFRRFLRSRNLKYTPERADILDAILELDGLFEVDALLEDMRKRGYRVSKATVYRTIRLLQEAGIVTQSLFDSRQSHYQLIYGKDPLDAMICMKTGKHIAFQSPELLELRNRICEEHGWTPAGHRLLIYAVSE